MNPEPLPPNLRELEELLARRPGPEPPADLRARVLRAGTNAPQPAVSRPAGRRWRWVWQVAAAVVLALNLGMSAANGIRFQRLATAPTDLGQPAARPVVLDAFEGNDRFGVVAASALATLTPAPDVSALSRTILNWKEESEWVLH